MSELRRFSHSLVDCYLRCPRQAEFRYVERIDSPKSPALVKGSACDRAWNDYLVLKLEGDDLPTVDELVDETERHFREDVRDQGGIKVLGWEPEEAREHLSSAKRLTEVWATRLAPDIEPAAVQVELHRELPSGRDFVGFLDWQGRFEGREVVGDNKTGSRKFGAGDADKNLQPSAYAFLRDEPIDFVFARAIDKAKPEAEAVLTHRSAGDIGWYAKLVDDVERAFTTGIFPTNPTSPLCGPKHCSFFERCQPHRITR